MEDQNEKIQITMRGLMLLAKIAAAGEVAKEDVLKDEMRLLALSSVTGMQQERVMDNLAAIANALEAVAKQQGLTTAQVIERFSRQSSDPEETQCWTSTCVQNSRSK